MGDWTFNALFTLSEVYGGLAQGSTRDGTAHKPHYKATYLYLMEFLNFPYLYADASKLD